MSPEEKTGVSLCCVLILAVVVYVVMGFVPGTETRIGFEPAGQGGGGVPSKLETQIKTMLPYIMNYISVHDAESITHNLFKGCEPGSITMEHLKKAGKKLETMLNTKLSNGRNTRRKNNKHETRRNRNANAAIQQLIAAY